jgi:hypothetical protein
MLLYHHTFARDVGRVEARGFAEPDTDAVGDRTGVLCWDRDLPRVAGAGKVLLDVPAAVAERYEAADLGRPLRWFVLPLDVANACRVRGHNAGG